MKKIILFLLITLPSLVFSQETQLSISQLKDSLKKYQYKLPDTYIKYASILEKKLTAKQQTKELILLKNYITRKYYSIGQYEKALNKIDEALLLSKTVHNDSLLAVSYKNKGNVFAADRKYINAIKEYSKCDSLTISETLHLLVLSNYAKIKERIGAYEEGIEMRKLINTKLEETTGKQNSKTYNNIEIAKDYLLLLIWYDKKKHIDSLQSYINKARKTLKKKNNNILIIINHYQLTVDLMKNKKTVKISDYDSIYKAFILHNNINGIESVFYLKAYFYYRKNEFKKSLHYLQKIDSISKTHNKKALNNEEVEILYAKTFNALKQYQEALTHQTIANRIIKKKEREKAQVAKVLNKQYNYSVINHKISELKNEIKNKKTYIEYLYIVSFLVLISIYAFFIYRKKSITNKFNKIIQESEKRANDIIQVNTAQKSKVPQNIRIEILRLLKQFETTESFLNNDLDLNKLANYVNSNRTYTTMILKEHYKKSFKEYLYTLRIDYAIRKLRTDNKFRSYTIEAIAYESGFNTGETFSKYFQKQTKMLPSTFIKQLKNKK